MTDEEMLGLMKGFRKAYGKADREGLAAATTDDFEWHMHYASQVPIAPRDVLPRGSTL